jgi:hypothetical protein
MRMRWLIATMVIVGASWGSGLEDVGENSVLGPDGLLATIVTFSDFVVIPYLVVVLTARGREREQIELPLIESVPNRLSQPGSPRMASGAQERR